MLNEVAGLRVPTGQAAEAARLVCTEYADDALYNHSVRSYFFGAAWARARGLDFDSELLYVSALLHDLGLTPPFDSHTVAFEEAGGHVARVFTAGLGWPTERRDRAAEVIVLHMRDEVAPDVDVESRLLQEGTSADVTWTGLEEYDPEFTRALVAAYPAGVRRVLRPPLPGPGRSQAGVRGGRVLRARRRRADPRPPLRTELRPAGRGPGADSGPVPRASMTLTPAPADAIEPRGGRFIAGQIHVDHVMRSGSAAPVIVA